MKLEHQNQKNLNKLLEDEFKDLHLHLPVLEVLVRALIYNAILDKYVESLGIIKKEEVHIGKLKLLDDFYVIDMEKDPATPLLVGRGILATASFIIDCRKAKIEVGEGITRSIFRVTEIDLGDEEVPYWTTLGKQESYEPRPPYYAKKDFMDYHLPGEWEIARDAKLNPFKDVLVFRKMVEFLGAIPINLKINMSESEELVEKRID
ncbi:hypothetical protein Tco_0115749 [Tanacetum coccineum]